jgi:cold-inducible RNA-binding protein
VKLYVGNVPYQATDEDLQSMFTQAGATVDSVNIVRDRFSGEPRGFAFVEIGNDEEAQKAIRACNGKDLLGRTLVVNEARPPREGGGSGGPGGGRGRGGGGGGGGGGGRGRW